MGPAAGAPYGYDGRGRRRAFGVLVVLSLIVPDFIPSKSMDKMPWPIVILVSGFLGAGGLLALTGLNWWGDKVSTGWAIEQLGWWMAAGGFATYSLSVSWHYPGSAFAWACHWR